MGVSAQQLHAQSNDGCIGAPKGLQSRLQRLGCFPRRPEAAPEISAGTPLKVSAHYRDAFEQLLQHLSDEMQSLEDKNLEQECEILRKLMGRTEACDSHPDD